MGSVGAWLDSQFGLHRLSGVWPVKKGRHRRYEEARSLKRSSEPTFNDLLDRADEQSCPECDALPGHDHASWCLAEAAQKDDDGWR